MVNGNAMLSSASSSLLLSTALPPLNAEAGATDPLAGGQAGPGFAELLNGLAAEAETKEGKALAGELAASKAAIESGKILPVALPETAETDGVADVSDELPAESADAETTDPLTADVEALLGLLGPAIAVDQSNAPAGTSSSTTSAATPALPHLAGKLAAKPQGDSEAEGRKTAPAVQITAATTADPSEASPAASTEPRVATPAKTTRPVEQPRVDASLAPQPAVPTSVSAVSGDQPATAQTVPMVSAPAQAPSPADINAALDRLVAAREALMPAEAALSVEHAEFGEVSIRFEQSPDGKLSAELRAADPDLQRAITAAVGAERGLSTGADGDGGRSPNLASQRGSAAGGDAAQDERGHGSERELDQRRGPGRAQSETATADPRPGVFA